MKHVRFEDLCEAEALNAIELMTCEQQVVAALSREDEADGRATVMAALVARLRELRQ